MARRLRLSGDRQRADGEQHARSMIMQQLFKDRLWGYGSL